MSESQRREVFGRRPRRYTVVIARGDRIRHFTVNPWLTAVAGTAVGLFAVAYLLATSYLVLRDNLLDEAGTRQAHIEQSYEERIAALRAQVDRLTSRQFLDQETIKERVRKLYERQQRLALRHGQLDPLLERARLAGLLTSDIPVPVPKPAGPPARSADASTALEAIATATGTAPAPAAPAASPVVNAYLPDEGAPLSGLRTTLSAAPVKLVGEVARSLDTVETEQMEKLKALTDSANAAAGAIRTVLETSGLPHEAIAPEPADAGAPPKPAALEDDGIGGPYIRIDDPAAFGASLDRLDRALDRLEGVQKLARKLPFGHPLSIMVETSPFGRRDDPFLEGMAFHPGIDFRARSGTEVRSTGAGTVTHAGWAGGYGNMVEVDHGNGVTTRYGHLSSIAVGEGDHVTAGEVLGRSGSTGRSTGPHLHYEVRLDDHPIDPERLLSAGRKLQALLRS